MAVRAIAPLIPILTSVLVGVHGIGGVAAQTTSRSVVDARDHYNAGRFADAMAVAKPVWQDTADPEAGLVLARAKLERFRATEQPADLETAQDVLGRLDPGRFNAAQAHEWEVGVAQALFLQGEFGAAAELFRRLLASPPPSPGSRDRLLEWWASAMDRLAAEQTTTTRRRLYDELVARLETESARSPTSAVVPFWLAAASRAAGDPDRAWHLAIAGWVRAPRTGTAERRLRADLDRLVLQGIIPDLAVRRTGEASDHEMTVNVMADLAAEWEALTTAWAP